MPTWTDDPIVPGSTRVKAIHINELRSAINTLRSQAGMSTYPWTDRTPNGDLPASTRIKAIHFNEFRLAIHDLWLRKQMRPIPNWSYYGAPRCQDRIWLEIC